VGKLEEAGDCFERAAEINPMALSQMVNARRFPDDPEALIKMSQLADNPLMPQAARISMSFALADLYDKRKEPDQAWPYLELANRLTDKGLNFDPDTFSKKVDLFCQTFNKDFLHSLEPIRGSDRIPIFVVGMPRSGTTLTEQILSSHAAIFGAGELDLMARLTGLLPRVLKTKTPYPGCVNQMTPHLREEAARFYLHGLYQYDQEHTYVVDKMPHNFMQLGLIAMIFPKARIIHVRRDPRDTALSNFQQNFKAKHGALGYAFHLENTARQINDYHRMMEHWKQVLPLPIFELTYEELISNQDEVSREMLTFVGVDWDEQVREFHKTERAVRTASVSQVRQPIYKTSQQKWRKYEKYLGPFLENLNPETYADWEKRG
jgi:tetratricopeptide (TPR) repeat protein